MVKWLCVMGLVGTLPLTAALVTGWAYIGTPHQVVGSSSTTPTKKQRAKTQKLQQSYIIGSLSFLLGSLLLSLLLGLWFLRDMVAKLHHLRFKLRQASPDLFKDSHSTTWQAFDALQSDLDQLLEEFREQQQNEAFREQLVRWQDVARRLAHEIRNPLTPILLSIQELQQRYKGDDPRYQRQLKMSGEIIHEEVDTLKRLVQEFSSFAKLPETRTQPEELNRTIRDFLDAYNWFQEQARVTFEEAPHPIWVQLDRMLFRRVLHNLVENAIEAGSPFVCLRAGVLPDESALCQVEDRGPGIPAHLQRKIFTPYFTTKQFGTGLGLSITKKIVIDHGGAIHVVAHPEGGSIFHISLRPADAPAHPAQEK